MSVAERPVCAICTEEILPGADVSKLNATACLESAPSGADQGKLFDSAGSGVKPPRIQIGERISSF